MDVLLVGGTGVISTGITRQLVEADHDVTVYNRGETDADLPPVDRIRGDRTEYDRFERQVAEAGPFDCVIDMVCYTPDDARSAVRAFDGLTDQYVFCSTVATYRQPAGELPIDESAPRKHDGDGYGGLKTDCEEIFQAAHDDGAFAATVLRPGHTYGEGGVRGGLCYTLGWERTEFVDRLRAGEPIVVHGDGTSIWGSTHRDDVARAFVNAVGNEDAHGERYNVASEEPMTWNAYLRAAAQALDAPEPDLVHVPTAILADLVPEDRSELLLRDLQYSLLFDNSKAKADLDYEYTVPWTEGVRRTVSWLDERGEIADSEVSDLDDRIVAAWEPVRGRVRSDFEARE
jgi:nucleoside-diphosphate-sugar epimerase